VTEYHAKVRLGKEYNSKDKGGNVPTGEKNDALLRCLREEGLERSIRGVKLMSNRNWGVQTYVRKEKAGEKETHRRRQQCVHRKSGHWNNRGGRKKGICENKGRVQKRNITTMSSN